MLVVWSWLRELLELEQEVTAEEAAAALTRAGLEVEEFRPVGDDFSGVVIAEVVSKAKHENADKLTVVQVITEAKGQPTTVVCGAPNVPDPGGYVLWARPGARLPGGFEIGSKKLKGVESAGMLCSGSELGLSDDHDGIVVLRPEDCVSFALGADAAKALALTDVVFDLCIPANRADALGHLGVARELAALLGGRAKSPESKESEVRSQSATPIVVEIEDSKLCPRYVAQSIKGLRVGPSPLWLQQRLKNVGVRPINNLVDVTNYVMFELGQPLHAFDADKLKTGKIRVRRARADETIVTLDQQERKLVEDDLLITDGEKPVAIAGVMGGLDTEVDESTRNVVLESAIFDPISIRRTSRRLGLHSEASHRFERAVDPSGAALVARRAASLLATLGGGTVLEPPADIYPVPIPTRDVSMRLSRCAALSGVELDAKVIEDVLTRQGMRVKGTEQGVMTVEVPTSRSDVTREVDLIEEVVRIYGFDRVPATLPATTQAPQATRDNRIDGAKEALLQAGYCETLTYGFTSLRRIENLGLKDSDIRARPISVTNPMTIEHGVMRTSLWCNLLAAVEHNLKHDVRDVALFEVGHCFWESDSEQELPHEPLQLCAVLCGCRESWLANPEPVDFFDIKGAIGTLFDTLYGPDIDLRFEPGAADAPYLHPGVAATITLFGKKVGEIGELHPSVRDAFDLSARVYGCQLDLGEMPSAAPRQMAAIARYPAITRDISMLLDAATPAQQVIDIVNKTSIEYLEDVQALEDYRDPAHVPSGQKGMLWSITYRSPDRTLTDAEVDALHGPLEETLLEQLRATRR